MKPKFISIGLVTIMALVLLMEERHVYLSLAIIGFDESDGVPYQMSPLLFDAIARSIDEAKEKAPESLEFDGFQIGRTRIHQHAEIPIITIRHFTNQARREKLRTIHSFGESIIDCFQNQASESPELLGLKMIILDDAQFIEN